MTALSIADCQLPIGGFIASLQIVAIPHSDWCIVAMHQLNNLNASISNRQSPNESSIGNHQSAMDAFSRTGLPCGVRR
jgi:hypothetical protein